MLNNSGENQVHKRQKIERMESFARISFEDTIEITPSTSTASWLERPEILRAPSDPGYPVTISPGHHHLPHHDKRRLFARSKTDNSCYSAAIDVSKGLSNFVLIHLPSVYRSLQEMKHCLNHLIILIVIWTKILTFNTISPVYFKCFKMHPKYS